MEALSRHSTNFANSSSSPAKPSMSSAKRRLMIVLLPVLTMPSWSSKDVYHDPFQKYVEEGRWEYTSLSDSNCCSEPVSYAAVEEDCTCDGGFWWLGYGWCWCCIYSWLPTKLHAKLRRRPSWSLWGRGFAASGDISHRGFVGWRSALWCSFLLLNLPVLQRSSLLVASICSVDLQ